jgi:hypothetical protein
MGRGNRPLFLVPHVLHLTATRLLLWISGRRVPQSVQKRRPPMADMAESCGGVELLMEEL